MAFLSHKTSLLCYICLNDLYRENVTQQSVMWVYVITTIFTVFYSFQVLTALNFVHYSISNKRMQVFFLTKDRGLTRCIRWSSFQEVFDLKVSRQVKQVGCPNVNFDFAIIYLKFSDPLIRSPLTLWKGCENVSYDGHL